MSDIIKVKVVKMSNVGWWYQHMIGKTINVELLLDGSEDYYTNGSVDDNNEGYILKSDCIVLTQSEVLQHSLQQAKAAVEAIEKQMAAIAAEEAEKEASRPLTQAEYERVVAEYRASKGRKVFEKNGDNYCIEMGEDYVQTENWGTIKSVAPFGVFFQSSHYAREAIAEVGEGNLKKAWAYEMNIGLKENV